MTSSIYKQFYFQWCTARSDPFPPGEWSFSTSDQFLYNCGGMFGVGVKMTTSHIY
jgi:hypothetical protein